MYFAFTLWQKNQGTWELFVNSSKQRWVTGLKYQIIKDQKAENAPKSSSFCLKAKWSLAGRIADLGPLAVVLCQGSRVLSSDYTMYVWMGAE